MYRGEVRDETKVCSVAGSDWDEAFSKAGGLEGRARRHNTPDLGWYCLFTIKVGGSRKPTMQFGSNLRNRQPTGWEPWRRESLRNCIILPVLGHRHIGRCGGSGGEGPSPDVRTPEGDEREGHGAIGDTRGVSPGGTGPSRGRKRALNTRQRKPNPSESKPQNGPKKRSFKSS